MILGSASAVPPAGNGTMMRIVALGYVAMSPAPAGAKVEIIKAKVATYLTIASTARGATIFKNDSAVSFLALDFGGRRITRTRTRSQGQLVGICVAPST